MLPAIVSVIIAAGGAISRNHLTLGASGSVHACEKKESAAS
jgi:hypothetical protein